MSTTKLKTATIPAVESWTIDNAHSRVGFHVRHFVISKVHGLFTRWNGTLVLGGPDLADSKVEISIDAASIDTGEPQRDAHLKSADFFDAERFPTLDFRSRKVESAGEDRYRVTGDLTIHGVTREVTLDVEEGGRLRDTWGKERVAFLVKTTIDRRDYGLTWNVALETGGVMVSEKVEIEIEIEATKAA
jgi:polyisoprenoid-binding protein YceI